MQKAANGSRAAEILLDDPFDKEPTSWSPDGKHILYVRRATIAAADMWVLPVGSDAKPFELAYPGSRFATFSPDGHWVAFSSAETGRLEAYVAPFPGPGSASQVSTTGGINPRWRADGKELFFLSTADDLLMSAPITFGRDRVDVGAPKPLFKLPWIGPRSTHDIAADGERILALVQPSAGPTAP
ncbi:MAG: TolB family protein [Steroidobacteraceae bacterium]